MNEEQTMKAEVAFESLKDKVHEQFLELQELRKSYDELTKSALQLNEIIKEKQQEIERLNNIIKVKDEGFKASTEDLCEESIKAEKLEKLNKKLWEENTRLRNGRNLEQNAIDTLRDRIDKAIELLENANYWDDIGNELLPLLKGSDDNA